MTNEEQEVVLGTLSQAAKDALFERFLSCANATEDLNALLINLLKEVQRDFAN